MAGFDLPEEISELAGAAARFGAERLAPAARQSEGDGRWPPAVLEILAGFSLSALDLPERLGGAGGGCAAKVVVLEALATADAGGLPAADQPGVSAGALVACPDRRLAAEVAAAVLSGDAQAALLVVDADADPGAAQQSGPALQWAPGWPPLRWVWVSGGDTLRLHEAPAETPAVAALAFQASGGVSAHLAGTTVVGEWDLPVGAGVDVRGRARLWLAAVAVGVAQSAFDATIDYTTDRIVFGRPVAHHQGNAFQLAGLATELHGARLAVRDAAARYDEGDPHAGFWATQAWVTAVEAAVGVTDAGIQLLGGHGFLVDHLAEKRFREARMLALLAGGRDAAEADLTAQVLDVPGLFAAGAGG